MCVQSMGPFLAIHGTMTCWWMGVRDYFSPPLRTNTHLGGVKEMYIRKNNFCTINSSFKHSWLCDHRCLCCCVFLSFLYLVLWRALEVGHGARWAKVSVRVNHLDLPVCVMKYGWPGHSQPWLCWWVCVKSTVDIDCRSICFWCESHRRSISTDSFRV